MIIKLEDINNSVHGELYISTRKRLASATSVHFIDAKRMVVCNLVGKRMYLIHFDIAQGTHQIKSCIPTQYGGQDIVTDLIDFDGRESIVTSNCGSSSASLYRLTGDGLCFIKDVPINDPEAGFCHGVKFLPPGDQILCVTCVNKNRSVYFISIATGEILYRFSDGEWKPKDICFIDESRMAVLYAHGRPTAAAGEVYKSKVSLVRFNLSEQRHEVLDEIMTNECHMDCCRYSDGRIYANNQTRDSVLVFKLDGNRLSLEREIGGYLFPHGIDLLHDANLLAVTNYGDNTVVLSPIPPAGPPPLQRNSSVLAVVTHFQCEQWLEQCLDSLLAQTRPPENIVVIDDGSAVPPQDIVEKYPQVTLLAASHNVGPYCLIQSIINLTDYDAILMQDADDWSAPDRLARLLAESETSGAEIISSQFLEVYKDGRREPCPVRPALANAAYAANPAGHFLCFGAALISRSLVQRLGGFATGLRFSGDGEFFRRAHHIARISNISTVEYFRRKHNGSLTQRPETGMHSPARMALTEKIKARARENADARAAGQSPNLDPFCTAPPVPLRHLTGPPLRPAPAPEVTLIAGMHRSGTSMIAHLLHLCGLHLGPREELGLTDKSNRDGHWENARFLVINEAILNELGGAWDLPPSPPSGWLESDPIQKLVPNARAAVAGLGNGRTWGWKDPRNSLTLPFWKSLIPGLKVVICLRNPLEVALSLRARGVSSYAFGLALWKHYYRELLAHTRPAERIITHYEAYFTDPIQEVRRVLAFLGLPASENALSQCRSTVKGDMRNHRIGTPDLTELRVETEILQLYQELCAEAGWAPTTSSLPVQAQKDYKDELSVCLQKKAQASARSGAPLDHLLMDQVLAQREIGALRGERDRAREKIHALEQRLAEQIRTASARQDQLSHLQNEAQREIGALRGERDRAREKIQALEQRLAEQVRTASARQDELEQRTQEMRRGLEAQLAHRDQVISDERDQKSRLQAELKQHAEQAAHRERYTALLLKISQTLRDRLPASARILVVSKGDEGLLAATGYDARHFPADAGGAYRGYHPADSAEAVALLTQAQQAGGEFFVLPETAFWWLECYTDFRRHLETQCPAVAIEETCKIYDLRPIA